jgi:ABC-type Fe3+-hydroxamate transport system substrate-binding protein
VGLTCAVTSAPSGSVNAPTCTVTAPAAIAGTQPVTATLTINTAAAASATLHKPSQRIFTVGGGAALAVLLFFCVPLRRRKWSTWFGLLIFSAIAAASIGCVGHLPLNSSGGGTSPGNYIVTVTGTSGSTTVTAAVNLTVE